MHRTAIIPYYSPMVKQSGLADPAFSRRLLAWFDDHGRSDLPWQRSRDPYPVWVSEIMLQQTQVETVIPYFGRFLARFPDIASLAAAGQDQVMALWAGLGYYARARNLHRAARVVMDEYGGEFPRTLEGVMALPGIGRSTAGAILAFCHGQRHPILDGNVKRVLCRVYGVEGYPGTAAVQRTLWELAERLTPRERVADYTQAIMDLGATLCTRARPDCPSCPMHEPCRARIEGRQQQLPTRKPPKARPQRQTGMLLLAREDGAYLLEKRPSSGLWGGLWSLPETALDDDAADHCRRHTGVYPSQVRTLAPIRHGFTHFDLEITPILCRLDTPPVDPVANRVRDVDDHDTIDYRWFNPNDNEAVGLPAAVNRIFTNLDPGDLQHDTHG